MELEVVVVFDGVPVYSPWDAVDGGFGLVANKRRGDARAHEREAVAELDDRVWRCQRHDAENCLVLEDEARRQGFASFIADKRVGDLRVVNGAVRDDRVKVRVRVPVVGVLGL